MVHMLGVIQPDAPTAVPEPDIGFVAELLGVALDPASDAMSTRA